MRRQKTISILVLLVMAVGVGSLLLQWTRPQAVTVSGLVVTPGHGSDAFQYSVYGTMISFTSSTSQSYNATAVDGRYSIVLPNDQTYHVQITALGEPSLTCSAGTLNINQGLGNAELSENWSC